MTDGDRRRLSFAALLTLIALPALWVISRDGAQTTTSPTAGAVGVQTPSLDGERNAQNATTTTEYVPRPPVFLDGDVLSASAAAPPVQIQRGTVQQGNQVTVQATFRRYSNPSNHPCTTPYAPGNAEITVRNVANGQEVTCRNNLSADVPAGIGLVLHTDLFASISNLADAPIAVQLSW